MTSVTARVRCEHCGHRQQEHLFQPASTLPKRCSCGCTAKNLCPIDAAITHGGEHKWAKRPRTCLNNIGQTDLPEDY